jgi:drug/metabolite transporter (DMT)-like permease
MAGLRTPTAALLTAAGLWGMAVSGTKYALGGFDPVTLLSIELMAGAGVLWAALLIRGYRPPGSWWLPVLLGLLEPALAYLGDTFGLSLTSAVHGAMINGLESGLVVVLAGILLRETITRPAIVAVVAALAGLAVLADAGAGHSTAAGDLLLAGGVLSASLYTIAAKRFEDGSDALSLTAWQFTAATLLSVLVTTARWTAGAGTVPTAPRFWLIAVLVGTAGFGASFLLFNMVIVDVDAGRAAIVLNLIPVVGVVSAVIFLREEMTSRDALGAVLIGSSVLYFTIADRRDAASGPGGSGHGCPELAQDGRRPGRVLQHPPVAEPVEGDRPGAGPPGGPGRRGRAQEGILAGDDHQPGSRDGREVRAPLLADVHGRTVEVKDAVSHGKAEL